MHARTLELAAAAAAFACALSSTGASANTLYERLGGYGAIQAVVDQMITNVAADHRINKYFAHADIPRLRRMLADQICSASGGWCVYGGKDMKTAHAGMHIRGRDFNALVQDLGMALNKFKVPAPEQHELVALLAPLKGDIVGR
ncbi:MAG TPA: group 1 truncated hemoglobin [Xanthobacteraceae bacterium]